MAEYGFLMNQGEGKSINMTSGARAASFLGTKKDEYPNWQDWNNCYFTDYVSGTKMYVIPIITGNGNNVPGLAYKVPAYVTHFNISGSKVTPNFAGDSSVKDMAIAAMQIYPAGNTGSYGLMLRDATDYSAITNSGMAGVVTYSARVLINGTWYLPANIPGRGNGVIFANFTNPNVSLAPTSDLTGVIATDFNGNSATVETYIIYVSSGFSLTIPQYGFAIYNALGQATFTSAHRPLLLRGEVTIPTPNGMQWLGAPAGVQQMMVPVCSPGMNLVIRNTNNYFMYRTGITMNGNQCAVGNNQLLTNFTYTGGIYQGWRVTSTTLPILDATDYF
ncbi:hypothetical protein EKN56_12550 [Limnobaculum zhutongyuii]|uniref:Uncharacterized protein n=1 Tax=Limnobaculum zhutongyuii TaxID=2498113 RepID=A0A411WLV0_9GAMM|nr:DUF6453 family protein [Limnobaculum zhutongyuii]QBH97148.1 hypothetical protein EKN56_12550 [Limnobaculum zhutongyuii]TQS88407.1 hypothetical protein ELQ32_10335 [Limnobaculum zhutongyuii]